MEPNATKLGLQRALYTVATLRSHCFSQQQKSSGLDDKDSKRNPGTKPARPWHSGNVTDKTTFPITKTHRVSQKKWTLMITA